MIENEFFRQINSIDTKAGEKLRYIITKARWCHGYATDINYFEVLANQRYASEALASAFLWYRTLEGSAYWKKLYRILQEEEILGGVFCIQSD